MFNKGHKILKRDWIFAGKKFLHIEDIYDFLGTCRFTVKFTTYYQELSQKLIIGTGSFCNIFPFYFCAAFTLLCQLNCLKTQQKKFYCCCFPSFLVICYLVLQGERNLIICCTGQANPNFWQSIIIIIKIIIILISQMNLFFTTLLLI